MAAPYNDTATLTNLLATAIDRKVTFALRSRPQFRTLADTKPIPETNPGTTIVWNEYADMGTNTTPLNEITDPTGKSVANPTRIQVTVEEYGDFTVTTKKLKQFTLDKNLDGTVARLIGNAMIDTIDLLVAAKLDASTNTLRKNATVIKDADIAAGTVGAIAAGDVMSSSLARYAVAKFRGASVLPKRGELFGAMVHPDVAHDIRAEAGTNTAWREPHVYGDQSAIWAAETGTYEGLFWVENPRCTMTANAGSGSTVDVYNSYFFGAEALAEAISEEFHTVVDGVIVDPLKRKTAFGWYGIGGWALYRPKALRLVQTSSSIGANA